MKKAVALLVVGIFCALGPVFGIIGTVIGMLASFDALGSKTGEAKQAALTAGINTSLYTTAAGFVIFPIGVVLIIIASKQMSRIRKERVASDDEHSCDIS